MISKKATYQPINFSYQYGYLIAFCFVLFLIAKPVTHNLLVLEANEYELLDTSEKENTSENETVSDYEDEHTHFYFNVSNIQISKNQSHSNYIVGQLFLNFNLDIQLPPPRV